MYIFRGQQTDRSIDKQLIERKVKIERYTRKKIDRQKGCRWVDREGNGQNDRQTGEKGVQGTILKRSKKPKFQSK